MPCNDKSKLIHSLEKIVVRQENLNDRAKQNGGQREKIAVVDVQKLYTKAASVNTVKDLSILFN